MADQQIVAFRAAKEIADALDKAARMHGANRSQLIKTWLSDRLQAEGFLHRRIEHGDDQTGQRKLG